MCPTEKDNFCQEPANVRHKHKLSPSVQREFTDSASIPEVVAANISHESLYVSSLGDTRLNNTGRHDVDLLFC